MSKHTPGPWKLHTPTHARPFVTGTDFPRQGMICELNPARQNDEQHNDWQANARLIAAAPEMRQALADLFEQCAMVHKHWGDGDNTKEADAAIEQGRALLARIDGVEP